MEDSEAPVVLFTNALDPPADEGTKRVAHALAEHLGAGHVVSVSRANSWFTRKTFLSPHILTRGRRSAVEVALYLPGQSATLASFLRATILRAATRKAIVLVALQPARIPTPARPLLKLLKPRVVLTPSPTLAEEVRRLGMRSVLFPLWVDQERFRPVPEESKKALREKYGLPEDAKIVLHVGHLSPLRNLEWIESLGRGDSSVLTMVVAGSSVASHQLADRLRSAGVRVISRYLPNIEEVYQLANVYVFPVRDERGAIGVPLSVLEAMSCNIPVVATRFGGLPRMFAEGEGVFFADDVTAFKDRVDKALLLTGDEIRTRHTASPYTQQDIVPALIEEARRWGRPQRARKISAS